MTPFLSRTQIRHYDQVATEDFGVPGSLLMEAAGRGAAHIIADLVPKTARIVVVCGTGSNGGDGFVVARELWKLEYALAVRIVGDTTRIHGDAQRALRLLDEAGAQGKIEPYAGDPLSEADVVVDALFGTGLDRPLSAEGLAVVEAINVWRAGRPAERVVVALDIPSGLDADTAEPRGASVHADHTVTFAYPKLAMAHARSAAWCGRIHVVDLGVPPEAQRVVGQEGWLLDEDDAKRKIAARDPDAHKGTAGHLLVVGGSHGKTGAALLAASAAYRTGAGLVTIAARGQGARSLELKVVEAMTVELPEGAGEGLAHVRTLSEGRRALVIGPGLGLDREGVEMARRVCAVLALPKVVDADALVALATAPLELGGPSILTPHPGEAARLLGQSAEQVQADRLTAARTLAQAWKAVVVLKGAYTVIVDPERKTYVAPYANPALAKGGTGDVLAGVIGALLLDGSTPLDAAIAGVVLHALAGEVARERTGVRGTIASDVVVAIAEVLAGWGL